jgi:hypothetical protein
MAEHHYQDLTPAKMAKATSDICPKIIAELAAYLRID